MARAWSISKDCCLCHASDSSLGRLLGPVGEDKSTGEALYVHRLCALWSPEVYQTNEGTVKNIQAAIKRGRSVRCVHCNKTGATLGCVVERCPCAFHLSCAKASGCNFLPLKYFLSCKDHTALLLESAKAFCEETSDLALGPQTADPFNAPVWTACSPTVRAGREDAEALECGRPSGDIYAAAAAAKQAGTTAAADAIAAVNRRGSKRRRGDKWERIHEACREARRTLRRFREGEGDQRSHDSDEETFALQERARYAKDREAMRGLKLQPGAPVDYEGWALVGGLADAVRQLKEMVILPLAYPHVFGAMGISPPRGILLHGAPGCGKTLLARALAGACQMQSETPVTLFSRKGADCLGEFAGEAERNLRLLFEEATLQAPSVVFLDELDALVPSRRGNEGSSDQMYASVVTTLLALMDGMADRGNVVVIGATNRPESIDTALRRPGRFDREVYIGLPGRAERLEILRVHTRRWERPVSQSLLETIASRTEGYGGADLAALCTSAVMEAARRCLPELPDLAGGPLCRLRGSAANAGDDPPREADANSESTDEQILAVRQRLHRKLHALTVLESDWAAALGNAPPPCSLRQGLAVMSADLCRPIPHHLAPALLPPLSAALSHIHASTSSPGGKLVAAAAAGHRCLLRRREGLAAGEEGFGRLEALLVGLGAVESGQGSDGGVGEPDRKEQHGKAAVGSVGPIALRGGSLPGISAGEATRTRPPFPPCRILMCSDGDRGQYAAAGGLLALAGSSSVVVGLPQMLDAGGGSPSEGVSLLLAEAVQRSQAAGEALFVYLPHLEAWAFDTFPTQMGGPVKGSTDGPPPTLSPPGKLFSWTCCAGLQEPEGLSGAGEGAQTTAVWSAVAAALAEHQARRQLVVLATCGRDICAVPEEIVRFFRRGLLVDAALSDGGVVVFPVSLSGACHAEVVRRTAARAASEVLAVLRGAVLRAPPRPEAEGAGMGPSEGGTAEGPPHAEPGESEGRDRDADLGRRRPRLEANQATLDMGRSLCSKVQDALALLGRQLCADRRARLARVAQSSGAVRLRTRDGPVGTSQPLASFSDLGRALAKGHIRDLAELRAAATGLSTSIRKDAEPTRTSAGSWAMSRSTVSSAASAALQDEIEDWAASLEGWLGLTSPDAVAAMAAAERLGRQRAPGDSGNGAGCVPGRRSGGEAGTGLAACGPADSELPHGSEAAACNPDGGESDAGAAAAAAAVRREMAEWTAALERCLSERLPALAELSLSGSAWTPRQAEQFIGRCCQSARRCSEPLAGALAAGGGARGPGSPLALPDAERLAREVLSLIGGARGGRDPP